MATYNDAKAGWEAFLASGFTLTREDINSSLESSGFEPISRRTYQHFRKLARYGFTTYVPINQLDVKTLENPIWDVAIRNRYLPFDVNLSAQLRVTWEGHHRTIKGIVIQIGDAIAVFRAPPSSAVGLPDARDLDSFADLTLTQTGELRSTKIEALTDELPTGTKTFRLSFVDLQPLDELLQRTPIQPTRMYAILTPTDNRLLLNAFAEYSYWLLQTVEASRAIGLEYLRGMDAKSSFTLHPADVQRFTFSSPIEIHLNGSWPYLFVAAYAIRTAIQIRKDYHDGTVSKQTARRLNRKNDEEKIRARLEEEEIVPRAALALRQASFSKKTDEIVEDVNDARVSSLRDKQMIPSAVQLADRLDNAEIELDDPA